jgi:hypothetical protein
MPGVTMLSVVMFSAAALHLHRRFAGNKNASDSHNDSTYLGSLVSAVCCYLSFLE